MKNITIYEFCVLRVIKNVCLVLETAAHFETEYNNIVIQWFLMAHYQERPQLDDKISCYFSIWGITYCVYIRRVSLEDSDNCVSAPDVLFSRCCVLSSPRRTYYERTRVLSSAYRDPREECYVVPEGARMPSVAALTLIPAQRALLFQMSVVSVELYFLPSVSHVLPVAQPRVPRMTHLPVHSSHHFELSPSSTEPFWLTDPSSLKIEKKQHLHVK